MKVRYFVKLLYYEVAHYFNWISFHHWKWDGSQVKVISWISFFKIWRNGCVFISWAICCRSFWSISCKTKKVVFRY